MIFAPALGSCAGKMETITFRPRGDHAQLHRHDTSREFLTSLRIDDHGLDCSGGFAPDQLGDTQVNKVRNHTTGATEMLRVEVSIVGGTAGGAEGAGPAGGSLGTCLILLSNDEMGFMPYRIENFTLERLRFYQQKCEKMENMLQSYISCSYAWDEPPRPHRLVIEIPGAGRPLGAYALDEVREYPPDTLGATPERAERKWLVHVRAEGPFRVLSIVDASVHAMTGSRGTDSSTYRQLRSSICLRRDLGVRFLQGQYQQILKLI
ncbi:hypothetical protein R1flu_024784 [Riccia fluitans]|uniref:Uncharacterized protein n=1 Tax=Riccia fluitans TaxID=41844 RepID=A0ABD1XW14_9MARC